MLTLSYIIILEVSNGRGILPPRWKRWEGDKEGLEKGKNQRTINVAVWGGQK